MDKIKELILQYAINQTEENLKKIMDAIDDEIEDKVSDACYYMQKEYQELW